MKSHAKDPPDVQLQVFRVAQLALGATQHLSQEGDPLSFVRVFFRLKNLLLLHERTVFVLGQLQEYRIGSHTVDELVGKRVSLVLLRKVWVKDLEEVQRILR